MEINQVFQNFQNELENLSKEAQVLDLKSRYIGKNGQVTVLLKSMKDISPEERKTLGPQISKVKSEIEDLVGQKLLCIEKVQIEQSLMKNWKDITLRDECLVDSPRPGGLHPVTYVQRKLEEIFMSMGVEILDGPHVDNDDNNFTKLNFDENHPARDMQDTFWFQDNFHLLRTHTSTIQVRGMSERKPPFKFVAPGKVFRCERTDASHEMVFHQMEGMIVDEGISVGHLIYFMRSLLREVFEREVNVRLRPGYFPFVEPGFELDIQCLICSGKGCSVCKKIGWLELLPCGLVHPNVLKMGNIDPNIYSGLAFGLGLDRLVMMFYGINDIRLLHSGDLRFSSQFSY